MSLDPNIREVIATFRQQRTVALSVRCVLLLCAFLGIATLPAAIVDRLLFLSDNARIAVGICVYATSIVVLMARHGRQILMKQDARTIARMIESTRPELRGELLSLIELAEQGTLNTRQAGQEAQFSDLLHQRNRAALASVKHSRLFPLHMLWSDVRIFACSGILVTTACFLGDTTFRSHCERMLFPFANIERLSETLITLKSPDPLDGMIPAGEEFLITAEIRNHRDHPAFLEVRRPMHSLQSIPFSRKEMSQFVATLNSQWEPFSYRVRCNDAATRYHRFNPLPRPTVRLFRKHYSPPEYTLLPVKNEDSPDGHLKATAGTQISLEIESSQPFTSGHVVFSDSGLSQPLALQRDPKNATKATVCFELTQSGHYEIDLVAEGSGFRSAPGILYEIQAIPDLPPNVSLDTPSKDIICPISDKIPLKGQASDDFSVTTVTLETRHNSEQWRSVGMPTNGQKSERFSTVFDPLAEGCQIGDTLTLRFTATDSKGQRTDSNSVKISLGHAFESATHRQLLEPQVQIERQLAALQKQTIEAVQHLSKAVNGTQPQKHDPSIQTQLSEIAKRSLETAIQTSNEIRETLRTALRKENDNELHANLLLSARALNQSQFGALQPALQSLNRLVGGLGSDSADLQIARDLASQGEAIQRAAQLAVRAGLASAMASQLSEESQQLAKRRRQILEPRSPVSKPPSEPDSAAAAEDKLGERLDQLNRAEAAELGRAAGQLREISRTAADKLNTLPNKLQAPDSTAEKLQQALDATATGLRDIEPKLHSEAANAYGQLERALASDSSSLQKAKKEIDEIARKKAVNPERQSALTQAKIEALSDLLRADAQLESDQPDGPAILADSLHHVSRALDSAAEKVAEKQATPADASQPLETLGSALRTIEGAARIEEAQQRAERAAREALMGKDPQRLAELERALKNSLAALPKYLEKAGLNETCLAKSREAAAQTTDAATASNTLREALNSSEELVSKAKAEIAALAPSLASEMRSLASKSQAAASNSIELSKQMPDGEAIQRAVITEQRLDARIENLREALRAKANTKDILTEDGRQQSRDADAASMLLRSPERAAQALQAAAQRLQESATLLPKAADIQNQNGRNLEQLARHFENLEKGDAEAAAKSRESMRQSEQVTGAKSELDDRQAKAEALSEMAKSAAKAEASNSSAEPQKPTADAQPKTKGPEPTSADGSPGPQSNSQQDPKPSTEQSKNAVRAAIDAQKQADRTARAEHSTLSGTPASASEMQNTPQSKGDLPSAALNGDQNWGRLPKRIATDLMQGRRETISGEYQPAIEAYFRAIAERAQQPAKPSK